MYAAPGDAALIMAHLEGDRRRGGSGLRTAPARALRADHLRERSSASRASTSCARRCRELGRRVHETLLEKLSRGLQRPTYLTSTPPRSARWRGSSPAIRAWPSASSSSPPASSWPTAGRADRRRRANPAPRGGYASSARAWAPHLRLDERFLRGAARIAPRRRGARLRSVADAAHRRGQHRRRAALPAADENTRGGTRMRIRPHRRRHAVDRGSSPWPARSPSSSPARARSRPRAAVLSRFFLWMAGAACGRRRRIPIDPKKSYVFSPTTLEPRRAAILSVTPTPLRFIAKRSCRTSHLRPAATAWRRVSRRSLRPPGRHPRHQPSASPCLDPGVALFSSRGHARDHRGDAPVQERSGGGRHRDGLDMRAGGGVGARRVLPPKGLALFTPGR